jgi:hypothetical protein
LNSQLRKNSSIGDSLAQLRWPWRDPRAIWSVEPVELREVAVFHESAFSRWCKFADYRYNIDRPIVLPGGGLFAFEHRVQAEVRGIAAKADKAGVSIDIEWRSQSGWKWTHRKNARRRILCRAKHALQMRAGYGDVSRALFKRQVPMGPIFQGNP